ncbi:hypothetical protein ACFL27_27135 [candidate division CSSED10-310 bacterium]|uniref:Uncharacterized protein n=1 Tax=candidate division CSSED10-310 bacterium TaxID=2855610 RepID=A0ABV6Z689_UNCC1
MARLINRDKLIRVLKYLYGLRDPKIQAYLLSYGLDNGELRKGWSLFLKATGCHVDISGSPILIEDSDLLKKLDDWENKWFPIIRATLTANYPVIHDAIFLNLHQSRGKELILTVRTLLERIKALGEDDGTPDAQKAFQLIEKRGCTPDIRQQAHDLLRTIEELDLTSTTPTENKKEHNKDVNSVWEWYKEWAAIARIAVPSKRLRNKLGI